MESGISEFRGKIAERLVSIAETADEGSYGRLLFDGGVAISLSSTLAATLNITTGLFELCVFKDTFDGADGVALFAAIMLFPSGLLTLGVIQVILTAFKNAFRDELRQIRQGREDGLKEARQGERQLAIRADLVRRDNESLADAMERLRQANQS